MTRRHFLLLDVDNTLYPRSCGVVERVDARINRYLVERVGIAADEVDEIRLRLWTEFGTTLHGLQRQARVDPADYSRFVHDIDHATLLGPHPELSAMLARIPLNKVAVTNGPDAHASAVLDCLGVRALFFRVFGLERLHFLPKPYVHAYQTVLGHLHTTGHDCVLVEDTVANLAAARQLGMRTIYVRDGRPPAAGADANIASILDLEAALAALA
jgi:putative hydrolase of the HAD superfamily